MRFAKLLLLNAALVGCTTADVATDDGRDDSFTTDGKLDAIQCTPQEAAAILTVANTATRATLENDVQLAPKAIDNILAYRAGDDEANNTADDEEFGSLAELDAVPYIGPSAFAKLLQYVRDADLVPTTTPREWTSSTIANGANADFALTKDGKPVVVYRDASGWVVRRPNGSTVALPGPTNNTPYPTALDPQIAVDGSGTVHVVYGIAGTPAQFAHKTLGGSDTTFTDRDPIRADRLWLDAGPRGELFALAHVYPSSASNARANAQLLVFASNAVTAEPLWEMHKGASISFNVGSDGFPALAWAGSSDSFTGLQYARRPASGWQQPNVAGMASFRYSDIAVSGTASSIIAVDEWLYRQNGQSVTSAGKLEQVYISGNPDAQTDENGVAHFCATTQDGTLHIQVDTAGNSTSETLGQGSCWLGLDENGTLHRLYTLGSVINHATYE